MVQQVVKGNGQAYRNPLTLHVPGALRYTSPGCVAQVLGGGLGVDVAKANRSVQRLVSVQAAKTVHPVHPVRASGVGGSGRIEGHGRSEVALTLNGQGRLGNERLGLGDVGPSTLAIVDGLPCPRRSCRECSRPTFAKVSTTRISSDETDQTDLCGNDDIEEVDETNGLIPHDLDLANQTKPADVIPKLFLCRVLV